MRDITQIEDVAELRKMLDTYEHRPACAEHSLLRLACLFRLAQISTLSDNEPSLLAHAFADVQKQLVNEEQDSTQIKRYLSDTQASKTVSNWKAALENTLQAWRLLRPFDVTTFLELVKKTDRAATLIKDQKVLLLLGPTGAGKSTTIHFLAGSEMLETDVQGMRHVAPVNVKGLALREITTSPIPRSETRYISAVPVRTGELGIDPDESVILCDTPGFEDTNGPEVDVANGIGLVRAVRTCKSVKPLVLVCHLDNGSRFNGIKNLAHTLVNIMPGIHDHMSTFTYFFTKYTPEEKKRIVASIQSVIDTLTPEEKADAAFVALLKDILKKAKKRTICIDPLKDKPGDIWDDLLEAAFIQEPSEAFEFFTSEKSTAAIQSQLRNYQQGIALAAKRFDYELIKYWLDELKQFAGVLNQEFAKRDYQACVYSVHKELDTLCQQAVEVIKRALSDGNTLEARDIVLFQKNMAHLQAAEALRSSHLSQAPSSNALLQQLLQQTQSLLNRIQAVSAQISRREGNTGSGQTGVPSLALLYADEHLVSAVAKLRLLTESFTELAQVQQAYVAACSAIERAFVSEMETSISELRTRHFNAAALRVEHVVVAWGLLSRHVAMQDIKTEARYQGLAAEVIECLQEMLAQPTALLKNTNLTTAQIECIKQASDSLVSAREAFSVQPHLESAELTVLSTAFFAEVSSYFVRTKTFIQEQFAQDRLGLLAEAETLIASLDALKEMVGVEPRVFDLYFSTIDCLCGYVGELKRDAEQALINIFTDNEIVPDKSLSAKLSECLQGLRKAQWIDRFRSHGYTEMVKSIEERVHYQLAEAQERFALLTFVTEDPKQLDNANLLLIQLDALSPLDEVVPEVRACRSRMLTQMSTRVGGILSELQKAYDLTSVTLDKDRQRLVKLRQFAADVDKLGDRTHQAEETLHAAGYSSRDGLRGDLHALEQKLAMLPINVTHSFPPLNLQKLNRELDYLAHCKQTTIQAQASQTLTRVRDYAFQYYTFIQQELEHSFAQVGRDDAPASPADYTALVLTRFNELQEIEHRTNCKNHFCELFTRSPAEVIEVWRVRLAQQFDDIKHQIDQQELAVYRQQDGLQRLSRLTKALSSLDGFMKGVRYIDLHRRCEMLIIGRAQEEVKEILQHITDQDYAHVALAMTNLKQLGGNFNESLFKMAYAALTNSLTEFVGTVRMQGIMLDAALSLEHVQKLVGSLGKLKSAQNHLAAYLESEQGQLLQQCEVQLKARIETRMNNFLSGVEALIADNSFDEASKKLDHLVVVRDLLLQYCDESTVEKITDLRDRMEKGLNELLNAVVQEYKDMPLSAYRQRPPKELYEKFRGVQIADPRYGQAWKKIESDILQKFKDGLKEAERAFSAERNKQLRELRYALRSFPDHLVQSTLEPLIQDFDRDSEEADRSHEKELELLLQQEDLSQLAKQIQVYSDEGRRTSVARLEETLVRRAREEKTKIDTGLSRDRIVVQEVTSSLQALFRYQEVFGKKNAVIKGLWNDVPQRVAKAFERACQLFCQSLSTTDLYAGAVQTQWFSELEHGFEVIMNFVAFYHEADEALAREVLPNFTVVLQEVNHKLTTCFTDLYSKTTAIDLAAECDVEKLATDLHTLKMLDSLRVKVRIYVDTHATKLQEADITSLVELFKKAKSHAELARILLVDVDKAKSWLIGLDFINIETKQHDKPRVDFYKKLNVVLLNLSRLSSLQAHLSNVDIAALQKDCLAAVKAKISKVSESLKAALQRILSAKGKVHSADYEEFNLAYKNLIACMEHVDVPFFRVDEMMKIALDKAKTDILQRIGELARSIETDPKLENVSACLIAIKTIGESVVGFAEIVNKKLDELLELYRKQHQSEGGLAVGKLGKLLEDDQTGIGQTIVAEHACFKGYAVSLLSDKMQKHGLSYVLDHIEGDHLDKSKLGKRVQECLDLYRELIGKHLKPNPALSALVAQVKYLAGYTGHDVGSITWDAEIRTKVPKLVAHIFALWTLMQSKYYFDAYGMDNRDSYLIQPHAAQVAAILRVLGISDKTEGLANHLVQIGTGEGKSVTLAVTAITLALLGVDVSCACYSVYLSTRDEADFRELFDLLGVSEHIYYGTFNQVCERVLNSRGDIRERVVQLIADSDMTAVPSLPVTGSARPKVLLIDEVDVFFSKDFYGSLYTPQASLRHASIKGLSDIIWQHRDKTANQWNLRKLKATVEYKSCCAAFPGWEFLIEEAAKDMLVDVKSFASHDYVVHNDKIAYQEQDGLTYSISYGYKTLFAYYHEQERGSISQQSLEENISIGVNCGSFSYAEMPKQFTYIMGVTGTLKTLSDPEKGVIQNVYAIKKCTYMPSVFGKNNLIFRQDNDLFIENKDDYRVRVAREITDRLEGKTPGTKRAVLVFFESKEKLREFYDSGSLGAMRDVVHVMTEEVSVAEKPMLIKRATTAGQVTLMTRSFGRGTDFVCRDPVVSANGGAHVLQTFLSETLSEETQIRGRTARQGDQGSYSIVLLDRELEKFGIGESGIQDLSKGGDRYAVLNAKRNEFFKQQYATNQQYVEIAEKEHSRGQAFITAIYSNDLSAVRAFLGVCNKGASGSVRSRTLCLMDATGSMSHLLQKAKNTVHTMFERASDVLQGAGIGSDSFEVQFAVYRNYNCQADKLLQYSPWESKPGALRTFMDTIDVDGGMGNEAIEIGLWHANRENTDGFVSQVILIGDMPPNTEQEVVHRRAQYFGGENYWRTTLFAQSTHSAEQVQQLKDKKVPIHTFFVDKHAQKAFRDMAHETGGRCEMLDINSPSGAKQLTDLVTEQILENVGGETHGSDLVDAYRKAYK